MCYSWTYTKGVQKKTELFKLRTNQHRVGAEATEPTNRQVLTTNRHLPRFAMSVSH
jgi:hypothetical protein